MGVSCNANQKPKLDNNNRPTAKEINKEVREVPVIKEVHVIKEVPVINIEKEIVECTPAFECQNSNELYTSSNYAVILSCGDTICLNCFNSIMLASKRCPFDGKVNKLETPIKNNSLMNEIKIKELASSSRDNNSNIPKCPNSHILKWVNKEKTCAVHSKSTKPLLGCDKDNYYLCLEKCLKDKITFTNEFCLLDHYLMWFNSGFTCVKCNVQTKYGFTCKQCESFTQCLDCSDFKFSTHLCPSKHELK